MKKIATGVFLIIFIFAVEVTYINYRLEQKLDALELYQQNILKKVYSLERTTFQTNQTLQQVIYNQKSNTDSQQNFLLTDTSFPDKNKDELKWVGIN